MGKEKAEIKFLDVSDLEAQFRVPRRGGFFYQKSAALKAVDGVSFRIEQEEIIIQLYCLEIGR
jgi:ABC-type oligopeptide transport system ATPase subunit